MGFTIHDSEPLTRVDADRIIADYPDHEVVYVHGDTLVWRERVVKTGDVFQILSTLDIIGCPVPRIILNMAEGGGK